jgi:predicted dehydrogenase
LRKDRLPGEQNLMHMIKHEKKVFGKKEPLMTELASFVSAVREGREPEVSGEAGRQALAVALEICEQIRVQNYSAQ